MSDRRSRSASAIGFATLLVFACASSPPSDPAPPTAATLGSRGGALVRTSLGDVEVVVRGRSFLLYLLQPSGSLRPAHDVGGSLEVVRGPIQYVLTLHNVGDHLVANSWRPEHTPFEGRLELRRDDEAIARARFAFDPPDEAMADRWPRSSGGEHHDHGSRHGGVVVMDDRGEYHFEIMLDRDGEHRIAVSDEFRSSLPPDHFPAWLTVARPGAPPERLDLIDEAGFLVGRGQPVIGAADARLEVDLGQSERWFVELAFPSDAPGRKNDPRL